jgi:hypothetical protein
MDMVVLCSVFKAGLLISASGAGFGMPSTNGNKAE